MYIGHELQVSKSGYRIIDDISSSFNGSTTSFALTVGGSAPVPFPINTQQIYISVNGVLQEPDPTGSAGFKLLGTNIVFSSAPSSGHAFFGVILAGADYVTVGTEFPAGSATSPSITFGTDNNTGLYSVTSGTMGFTADGVQTFTLDGNGLSFNDNKKLIAGTGSDLQIYHNGTDSFIDNATGGLKILGDTIRLKGKTADETLLKAIVNGDVELYYNNTERFATTNTGTNTVGVHVDDGATHDGDVTFTGASYNAAWDKSDNALEFTDNATASFGTGADLKILHDSSHSYINHNGTGDLFVQTDGGFFVQKIGTTERLINANSDGAVELFHNGTKKFETTANGISVTGRINLSDNLDMPDSAKVILGTGDDLQLYHNGSDSFIDDNGTGDLKIRTLNGNGIQLISSTSENMITCASDGAVELYYDNSKKFETTTDGIQVTGKIFPSSHIDLADDVKLLLGTGDDFEIFHDGSSNQIKGTGDHFMRFWTNGTNRFNITNDGHFRPETNNASDLGVSNQRFRDLYIANDIDISDNGKILLGDGDDLQIFHNGSASYIQDTGTGNLVLSASDGIIFQNTATTETLARFYENGQCELYHNNSKKFETNSAGVEVTGRAHIGDTTAPTAASGSLTGSLFITNTDNNYGMQFGVKSTGVGWIQQTRVDGTATDYDLQLQPAGGHVWMPDNSHLMFGAGNDLKIYSDGAAGCIDHLTTGAGADLILRSKTLVVRNLSDENMIVANENGSVNLYYDNAKTLETTVNALHLTGNASECNIKLMTSDGTQRGLIGSTNGGEMYCSNQAGEKIWDCDNNGEFAAYYDNTKRFQTINTGCKVLGADFQIVNTASNGTAELFLKAGEGGESQILFHADEGDNDTDKWKLLAPNSGDFALQAYTGSWENIFTATHNQDITLYYDNGWKFKTTASGIEVNGYQNIYRADQVMTINMNSSGANTGIVMRHGRGGLSGYSGKMISFTGNDNSEEGSIVIGTTATAYNTSSDYRLKENQTAISDGITRVKKLKPYRFNFKKDKSTTMDGFFAHEVTPVVPEAITGEKDEMEAATRYEEGDTVPSGKFVGDPKTYSTTKIAPQQIDQSKLVPLLTAALQEAITKIETLETKVAALESA